MKLSKAAKRIWESLTGSKAEDVKVPAASGPLSRVHLRFEGTVQQVGFRYETYRTATRLGLSGWVRNNPDGSVEAQVQGPINRIEILIAALEKNPRFEILRMQRTQIEPRKDENGFRLS